MSHGPCTCGLPWADHLDKNPQRAAALMAQAGCDGYRIPPAEAKTPRPALSIVRPRQEDEPVTKIEPATPQLLELAEAMRGPEWADDLAGGLVAATNAGWDWPRRFRFVSRMLADENARPRDLVKAVRGAARASQDAEAADPSVMASAMAEMRSALPGGES